MQKMKEPTEKIAIGDDSPANDSLALASSKMDYSYIKTVSGLLKFLQQEMSYRFQPNQKVTSVYVVPRNGLDASTVRKMDFSYLGTTSGILKILQQIYIVFIAAITYFCSFDSAYPGEYCYEISVATRCCLNGRGLLLYTSSLLFILFICLPAIHILMWAYILHKVEKWTNYSWHAVEYTICSTSAIMCLYASTFPLSRLNNKITIESSILSILILVPALLFILDIFLGRKKQKKNLQLEEKKLEYILTIQVN